MRHNHAGNVYARTCQRRGEETTVVRLPTLSLSGNGTWLQIWLFGPCFPLRITQRRLLLRFSFNLLHHSSYLRTCILLSTLPSALIEPYTRKSTITLLQDRRTAHPGLELLNTVPPSRRTCSKVISMQSTGFTCQLVECTVKRVFLTSRQVCSIMPAVPQSVLDVTVVLVACPQGLIYAQC
jgi:hypothetical protein